MIHNLKQGRCIGMDYRQCAQAGGMTFLVVDWLPWTAAGYCRECARSLRPDLIARFERSRGPFTLVSNSPPEIQGSLPVTTPNMRLVHER